MSGSDKDHWLERVADNPAAAADALAQVPASEATGDLRLHLQLEELAAAAAQATPAAGKPTIDWAAVAARTESLSVADDRALREAAEAAAQTLRRGPTAAERAAAVRPRRTKLLWFGWTAAAAMLLAAVAVWQVWLAPQAAALTYGSVARVPADQPASRYVLPAGELATVYSGAEINLQHNPAGGDQITQNAGRVRYEFGAAATTVASRFGVVAGQNAQLELQLANADQTGVLSVEKGQVLFVSISRESCSVEAGQTAYISNRGAIQVVATGAPAPSFNPSVTLPLPAAPTPTAPVFHPNDAAMALAPKPTTPVPPEPSKSTPVTPGALTPSAVQSPAGTPEVDHVADQAVTPPAHPVAPPPHADNPPPPADHGTPPDHPGVPGNSKHADGPHDQVAPPSSDLPPDDLPPDDFAADTNGPHGINQTHIDLPSDPTPAGANGANHGNAPDGSNAGGNSDGNSNAGGNGGGNAFGGGGNAGLHLGQGNGGGSSNGNAGGNGNGNAGGNGKGKGH